MIFPSPPPPRIEVSAELLFPKQQYNELAYTISSSEVARILEIPHASELISDPDYELAYIKGTEYHECLFTPDEEVKSLWALVTYLIKKQELVAGSVHQICKEIMISNGWTEETIPFADGQEVIFKIPNKLIQKPAPETKGSKPSPSYSQNDLDKKKKENKKIFFPEKNTSEKPEVDPLEGVSAADIAIYNMHMIRSALPSHLKENDTAEDIYKILLNALKRKIEEKPNIKEESTDNIEEEYTGNIKENIDVEKVVITRVQLSPFKKRIEIYTPPNGVHSILLPVN